MARASAAAAVACRRAVAVIACRRAAIAASAARLPLTAGAMTARSSAIAAEFRGGCSAAALSRGFASSAGDGRTAGWEAVRFTLSAADARRAFEVWAKANTPWTKPPAVTSVRSVYVPFWAFVADCESARSSFRRRGIDGPTLQVYAGESYPRSMLEVAKCSTAYVRPFTPDMLRLESPAASGGGVTSIDVDVEPFSLYEATAWQLARAAQLAHERELHRDLDLSDLSFYNVESRRVLLPLHVVEYRYLGQPFRVFVNGATGAAHGSQQQSAMASLSKLMDSSQLQTSLSWLLRYVDVSPQTLIFLANVAAAFMRPLAKVILWPPFAITTLLAVGGFAAAQSTAGLRAERAAFAAWEETRKAERLAQAAMADDWRFRPLGRSASDRQREQRLEQEEEAERERHRAASARSAAGASGAASGAHPGSGSTSSWWQEATSGSTSSGGSGTSSGGTASWSRARPGATASTATSGASARPQFKPLPPVDANDHYDVLGLREMNTRASTADIQAAFRRQLMTYHPDHQQTSEYDPAACSERTRLIIRSYGVLRDAAKRDAFDSAYRRRSR